MKLLGKSLIDDFKANHANCRKVLDRTVQVIEGADWLNPNDVKQTFGVNVDFVGKQTVFDSGGNKARLITKISFPVKIVLVTHVLDHSDYDDGKWKE